MAGGEVDGEGAARRRRQRRLRSWLKHERQSVAMALVEYTHHPLRGQTRARAREEVEYVKDVGLRAQKTALPGMRPALLSVVAGQQGAAVTVGCVAAGAPLLVVASLTGRDDVDATTVSFLVAENLKVQKRKEEEKERRRKREVAEYEARMQELDRVVWDDQQLTPTESSARVWDIPVVERRRARTVPNCAEDRRFVRCSSWWMLTRPLLRNDRDMVRQCRMQCWCRRCSLSKVVDFPSSRRN